MKKLFILLSLLTVVANAKMYKCQDADGNIQYTQTPTADCSREVETTTGQFIISGEQTAEIPEIKEEIPKFPKDSNRVENLSSEEIAVKNAKILKQNCDMAIDNLNLLNTDKPLAKNNKDGELVLYTKETREQERAKIQKYIDDNCTKQNK
ncbi:MAG TPA: DUF4124 domain-containing protein [Thioploca sp.]|nr:DUF4124 domain-containing protein [Thioploca sp.]